MKCSCGVFTVCDACQGAEPKSDVPECLEGMMFSRHDIELHLKNADAGKLSEHLNSYILQAYRMGESSK